MKCGRENEASATFCQSCGASLQQPGVRATTMPSAKMERPFGVTIIGIFQILEAIGILGLNALIAAYSPVLGLLFLPVGVIALVIGVSLFTGKNWARILMIIGGVLDIITIVGIPLGIIIIVYFRRQNVVAYFNQKK